MKRLPHLRIRRQQRGHRIGVTFPRGRRIANLIRLQVSRNINLVLRQRIIHTQRSKVILRASRPLTTNGASALTPSDKAGGAAALASVCSFSRCVL